MRLLGGPVCIEAVAPVTHRFAGKVAIVTGAASGMGRATAIRFAAEGANVTLGDINEAGAEETAATIRDAGGLCSVTGFDARDEASCTALVESTAERAGRLDVLANVAGISAFYRLDETTSDVFDLFLDVNLRSVLTTCREAMPHLLKTGGSIINFSSINARFGTAYHIAYDATKAAVLALTKSIAMEYSDRGVRCNAICPGGINTPMNDGIRIPQGADMRRIGRLAAPHIPFGEPEQVASVAAFLASGDASYINGEQIVVDGGLTSII